jgi:hypothetical protein
MLATLIIGYVLAVAGITLFCKGIAINKRRANIERRLGEY